MYSSGGWKIRPISCSSGLRSLPSIGKLGSVRVNGLEVMMMNSRKPAMIMPITDNTRATASCGIARLHNATASDQQLSSSTHSSSEPSCAPQVAAMR
ncbi:Uncharacterised protein [Acinetobacter baumannii]|nr:Uncharacterised protein [Acinetobacter baumannii]